MKRISYLLICLLGISIGLLIGQKMSGPVEIKEIEKIKTVKITDTVEVPEPIPYLIENTDTVYVTQMYVGNGEPLEVPLIKQTVTYSDSTYKAVVSGYNPKLEYVETYNTTHYITEFVREKPKKLGLGVFADVKFYEKVYMPVGGKITYRSNRWEFSGKVGKDLINNMVVGEAGANFDLIRF